MEDEPPRQRITKMLRKHATMWSGELGHIVATEHHIDVEPDTKPIRSMPYRQGPAARKLVKEQIETMLKQQVIEPSSSEWASPVVLVPKKDGSSRFCVDYRRLNSKL